MNTRYIANPDAKDVRNFMIANKRRGNHEDRQNRVAKFAFAAVLATGMAVVTPLVLYSKKTPPSIDVDGSSAIMQKGFCAVKCSMSGKGAFYSNDIIYVEDWSKGEKYWKKFYDRNENLLAEGIGNKDERCFFNPDHKGTAHFARALRIGNEWQTMSYCKGEEAVVKWNEAKVKY